MEKGKRDKLVEGVIQSFETIGKYAEKSKEKLYRILPKIRDAISVYDYNVIWCHLYYSDGRFKLEIVLFKKGNELKVYNDYVSSWDEGIAIISAIEQLLDSEDGIFSYIKEYDCWKCNLVVEYIIRYYSVYP